MPIILRRLMYSRWIKLRQLRLFMWNNNARVIRGKNLYMAELMEQRHLLSADAAPLLIDDYLRSQLDDVEVVEQLIVNGLVDKAANNELDLQLIREQGSLPEVSDAEGAAEDGVSLSNGAAEVAVVTDEQAALAAQQIRYLQDLSGDQFVVVDAAVDDYEVVLASFIGDQASEIHWETRQLGDATVKTFTITTPSAVADSEQDSEHDREWNSESESVPQQTITLVLLDGEQDGVEQISNILTQYENISALHILSHGDSGLIQLGNVQLSQQNLERYRRELESWGSALSDQGDILLYGCNVAAGTLGIRFVDRLAGVTGADIAASTDLTGGGFIGGDWVLEYESGIVELSAADFFAANDPRYQHSLLVESDDGTVATVETSDFENPAQTSLSAGVQTLDLSNIDASVTVAVESDGEINVSSAAASILYSKDSLAAGDMVVDLVKASSGTDATDVLDLSGQTLSELKLSFDGVSLVQLFNADHSNTLDASGIDRIDMPATGDDVPVIIGKISAPGDMAITATGILDLSKITHGDLAQDSTSIKVEVDGPGSVVVSIDLPDGIFTIHATGVNQLVLGAFENHIHFESTGELSNGILAPAGSAFAPALQISLDSDFSKTVVVNGVDITPQNLSDIHEIGKAKITLTMQAGVDAGWRADVDYYLTSDLLSVLSKTLFADSGFEFNAFDLPLGIDFDSLPLGSGNRSDETGVSSASLVVLDPNEVFNEDYMNASVGARFAGDDSADLNALMEQLLFAENLGDSEVDQILGQIATIRGVDQATFSAQYDKYLTLLANSKAIGTKDPSSLDLDLHGDYLGSTISLRYGQVVGDVFGIDAVFGALLNPTGGLSARATKPINLRWMTQSAITASITMPVGTCSTTTMWGRVTII